MNAPESQAVAAVAVASGGCLGVLFMASQAFLSHRQRQWLHATRQAVEVEAMSTVLTFETAETPPTVAAVVLMSVAAVSVSSPQPLDVGDRTVICVRAGCGISSVSGVSGAGCVELRAASTDNDRTGW